MLIATVFAHLNFPLPLPLPLPLLLPLNAQLVERYLHRYGKQLDEQCLGLVMRAPQCGNPLFLRLLMDELRVVGQFESLEQQITSLLQAKVG